jgi:hypothetical protein
VMRDPSCPPHAGCASQKLKTRMRMGLSSRFIIRSFVDSLVTSAWIRGRAQ